MKLLPEMLAEWVSTSLSPEEVGDLLTMTGFELEEILEVEGGAVLDVNIMANRGDGAAVLGLAREVVAKVGGATERFGTFGDDPGESSPEAQTFRIESSLCDGFSTLTIEGVENGPSPEWLQGRLRRMGQRPRSLLVDLTNYVMLEVGQPLHAYDLDRLDRRILVREASAGETLTTLDGEAREMRGGELLITDGSGAIGMAGIMGGASTEVSASTTRTLIEAAHFDARSVRATRKAHGMFTEASYRFERSVDPYLAPKALRRFAELYAEITGKGVDLSLLESVVPPNEPRDVSLRASRASRLLGYEVSPETCVGILRGLGMDVAVEGDTLTATIPTWRFDLHTETDLVEEVGRINGYEKIPALLPQGTTRPGGRQGYEAWRQRVLEAAIAEGFTQIIGHSLVPSSPFELTGGVIGPRTPASPEHRYLRSSLWTSLGMAARRNEGRDAHLFEIGKVFYGSIGDDGIEFSVEEEAFGMLSAGALNPPGLKSDGADRADFFTVKGALERILGSVGLACEFRTSSDERLHPTRQAEVLVLDGLRYRIGETMESVEEERRIGTLGQVHPRVAEAAGISAESVLASLDLRAAYEVAGDGGVYTALARTPAIRRDLAIVAPKSVPYAQIEGIIVEAAGELLERRWVFDLYEGPNLPDGTRSVGVAIELRKAGATFTDEEANRVRGTIAAGLEAVGATLRV